MLTKFLKLFLLYSFVYINSQVKASLMIVNYSPIITISNSTSITCVQLVSHNTRLASMVSGNQTLDSFLQINRTFPNSNSVTKGQITPVVGHTGKQVRWVNNLDKVSGSYRCTKGQESVLAYKVLSTALLRAQTNSKVVTVGEDVDLVMYHSLNAQNYSTNIRKYFWWKDNRKLNENGRIQEIRSTNGTILRIKNIQKSDSGIYFAHLQTQKKQNATAILLVVTNRVSICSDCKNGGICDDINGVCQCLPGFAGTDCSQDCESNHFGPACMFNCNEVTNQQQTTCRGIQICYSSGCNCASGWKGSNCDKACGPNEYGSDCLQRCDCPINYRCDAHKGCVCAETNISLCEDKQNSFNQLNDSTTNATKSRNVKKPIITISRLSLMVNPGETAEVDCTVTAEPPPGHGNVYLKSNQDSKDIMPTGSTMTAKNSTSRFEVEVESSYPGPYQCETIIGDAKYSKTFFFDIKVLPIPKFAPRMIKNLSTSLTINLNSLRHKGDGPITKTLLLFRKEGQATYTPLKFKIVNDTTVVEGLEPYTVYGFRVVLHRPGENKNPSPGPEALLRTNCAVPLKSPQIVHSYSIKKTVMHMAWKVPPIKFVRGSILGYTIEYKQLGIKDTQWIKYNITIGSTSSTTISHLQPQGVYLVRMQLYNCAGSSKYSDPVRVTMGKLENPVGPKVKVERVNATSIAYSWKRPSNAQPYTILSYEVNFREDSNTNGIGKVMNVTTLQQAYAGLLPYTSYIFKVRAYNHEGPGNYSDKIQVKTIQSEPTEPLKLDVLKFTYNSITLKWLKPFRVNGILKRYELQMAIISGPWKSQNCSVDPRKDICFVQNLEEYCPYKFRVRAYTIGHGPWSEVKVQQTKSLTPLATPRIIRVSRLTNGKVSVEWEPPPKSVHWGPLQYYQVKHHDDVRQKPLWYSKKVNGNETKTTITNLRTETVYHFCVAAVAEKPGDCSPHHSLRTSPLGYPSSAKVFKKVNVTETSVSFIWDYDMSDDIHTARITIHDNPYIFEPEAKQATIRNLKPKTTYEAEIALKNRLGFSKDNPKTKFTTKESLNGVQSAVVGQITFQWTAIGLGGLSFLFMLLLTVFIVKHCKSRSPDITSVGPGNSTSSSNLPMDTLPTHVHGSTFGSHQGQMNSRSETMNSTNSRQATLQYIPENMIIQWRDILFEDVPLGTGNFGQVVKAVVQKDNKIISAAVKTLKDGSTLEDKRDFSAELDTMIRIGKHKNVISLLGACEFDGTMYLCTEFAPLGNLLQYLRRSRCLDEGALGTYTTLTQAQLLQFAYEVAQGMTYLSEKQLIHRDLAARNVLLGEGCICKVADFGLSRGEGIYVKQTASRLPIRWMAIESLNYNVYTTKSDVWSFGILLWEIVSLGGTPYCGMSCAELYEKLPTGYRMSKPLNCDEEMYTLMYKCWKDRPHDRPTFFQLSMALQRICDSKADHNYVNLAIFENFNFALIDVNEEQA